jgi:hypothetical protein
MSQCKFSKEACITENDERLEIPEQTMNFQCAVKRAFLLDYTHAANAFGASLTRLQRDIGTVPQAEYDNLYEVTEEARERLESARRVMVRHVGNHGC